MKKTMVFFLAMVVMTGLAVSGCSDSSTGSSSSVWAFEDVTYGPSFYVTGSYILVSGTVRNVSTETKRLGKVRITATFSDKTIETQARYYPGSVTLEPGNSTRFEVHFNTYGKTVTTWELEGFESTL